MSFDRDCKELEQTSARVKRWLDEKAGEGRWLVQGSRSSAGREVFSLKLCDAIPIDLTHLSEELQRIAHPCAVEITNVPYDVPKLPPGTHVVITAPYISCAPVVIWMFAFTIALAALVYALATLHQRWSELELQTLASLANTNTHAPAPPELLGVL